MRTKLIHLPRRYKRLILAFNDFCLVELCLLWAFTFRLGWWPIDIVTAYWPVFVVAPVSVLFFFYRLELYSSVTRHAGKEVLNMLIRGISFGVLVALLVFFFSPVEPKIPRSVLILFWVFSIFSVQASRLIAGRWLHGDALPSMLMEFAGWPRQVKVRGRPVAVYGAGAAGRQLASALLEGNRYAPQAFVDDNPLLQGEVVAGLKVHSPEELKDLVASQQDFEIFLALPSVSHQRRQDIIRFLEPLDAHVRSVPAMDELAQGLVRVDDVREVDVADILGRQTVPANKQLLASTLHQKHILVTGAGGSIGSELCRQIIKYEPATLVMLDHCEYSLYTQYTDIDEAVKRSNSPINVVAVMASVADPHLLERLFNSHHIDIVYHAAAYKHVPLVESNGSQGFVNNVLGTLSVAWAVMAAKVPQMVLVSTDKAVRPTNIMGVTKRLAELCLQAISQQQQVDFSGLPLNVSPHSHLGTANQSATNQSTTNKNTPNQSTVEKSTINTPLDSPVANNSQFTMVRFGNVLDSSGSVIPKFRKQIRRGGPVTVTDPQVTRYFMTIPEAAELVLQANGLSEGGDVFILDMGDPIKIDELARKLIHLSGFSLRDAQNPEGDIEISYTGIRPGEKLYEELLIDEGAMPTSHSKIWRANERVIPWQELTFLLNDLHSAFRDNDTARVTHLLSRDEIGYKQRYKQTHQPLTTPVLKKGQTA